MRALLLLPLLACVPSSHLQPRAAEQLRRGYAWLDEGDLERAEVAFAHALEFHPDLPEAWNGRGVVAHRRGDLGEARACFQRALRTSRDFAEARVNLGAVALQEGRYAEAEASLRDALAIDPDLAVARLDLARTLVARGRAEPEVRGAHWAGARVEYLHLLETRRDAAEAWSELGYLDYESGRFGRAEQEYRRAVELAPSAAALHGLCISLVRIGRCAEAATACRQCLAAAPGEEACRRSLAGAEACPEPTRGWGPSGAGERGSPR